ncbi:tyrosine-type recombinase/integrase [Sulfurospirillum sp. 1307]
MQNKKTTGYFIRNNYIHVHGTIDGKRYRRSTKKKATKLNLRWIKQNHREVLLEIIDNEKNENKIYFNLEEFSYKVLNLTSKKRDKNTQKDYISKFKRLILPYFAQYDIRDIKVYDIERWQSILLERYSTITVNRVRNIFKIILNKAESYELINKNPINFAEKISVKYKKEEPYNIEEIKKILNNSQGWLKVFLSLAFTSGLRVGELIGLKWEDIDFNRNLIYLKRSISKGTIKYNTYTKNHNRIIIVPDFVIKLLYNLKLNNNYEWIFVSRLGKPFSDGKAILERHFKPLLKKIGVKYKKLKVTRHSYVTFMRNQGVSIDLLTEIVGHSKNISDKHYYTPTINEEKVKIINQALDELK